MFFVALRTFFSGFINPTSLNPRRIRKTRHVVQQEEVFYTLFAFVEILRVDLTVFNRIIFSFGTNTGKRVNRVILGFALDAEKRAGQEALFQVVFQAV